MACLFYCYGKCENKPCAYSHDSNVVKAHKEKWPGPPQWFKTKVGSGAARVTSGAAAAVVAGVTAASGVTGGDGMPTGSACNTAPFAPEILDPSVQSGVKSKPCLSNIFRQFAKKISKPLILAGLCCAKEVAISLLQHGNGSAVPVAACDFAAPTINCICEPIDSYSLGDFESIADITSWPLIPSVSSDACDPAPSGGQATALPARRIRRKSKKTVATERQSVPDAKKTYTLEYMNDSGAGRTILSKDALIAQGVPKSVIDANVGTASQNMQFECGGGDINSSKSIGLTGPNIGQTEGYILDSSVCCLHGRNCCKWQTVDMDYRTETFSCQ